MSSEGRDTLEKRARRAMLEKAFLRWESAVIISLTLLLTVFGPEIVQFIPHWGWLLGGVLSEAALVYSGFTDPKAGAQAVEEMLQSEFHPERLKDKRLQQQVQEALDYRSRIEAAIHERRDTVLKDNLLQTAQQIDDWLENIYSLANRLDRYQTEKGILDRDKQRAMARWHELEQKQDIERDPAIQQQIVTNIESLRRQVQTIESLEKTMDRARLQLENTLSALGTIYSQTMLVGAKDIDSGRAKRLRQEISEEVDELSNVLTAMDEVYAAQS
jgi:hypothetical protein